METVTAFLERLHGSGVKLSAENGQLSCYAQKGALTGELREGIVRFKPELLALLDARTREFPLSAGQKGLYVLQKLQPRSSAYNVPLCFRVNADVDPRLLAEAWQRVLDQYPILTARIVERDGTLLQRCDPACRTSLREHAFDGDDVALLAFLQTIVKEPFDLNRGPLTRIDWIARSGAKPVLLVTVHHVVFDGASAVILLKSLLDHYQQRSDVPAQTGYADFVAWEESMLASAEGASHLRYWQQQLDGDPPAIELPADLDGAPASEGTTLVDELPRDLCAAVREFSRTHALPPSVIFLGAFQLLLHRYTNEDDVIAGMPVMGRPAQQFASEIGYFINMVPLRARCGANLRALDFLRRTQGLLLDALYHSTYPFPRLVEALASGRRDRSAIFKVSYAYQNFVRPSDFLSLIQQQLFQLETFPGIWQEGDFDLGLEIYEGEADAFSVHLKYNPSRYSHARIASFHEHFCVLLRALLTNASTSIHDLPLLTEQETQLFATFNATAAADLASPIAHHQSRELRELRELSSLSVLLKNAGVAPGRAVGICMHRSEAMLPAILAVLEAGGACVPLDPDDPDERLRFMLRDSRAAIVLTEARLQDKLSVALEADAQLIVVDPQPMTSATLRTCAHATDAAFVLYESAPAGPRAVKITHETLANVFAALPDATLERLLLGDTRIGQWTGIYECAAVEREGVLLRPLANTQLAILDVHGLPQPVGIPGVLHVNGRATSDRAVWRGDATIQLLDTGIRIRGTRVDLAEIETRLGEHARIDECAVIARGERLIAFYRADAELADDELRSHLSRTLPAAMIPATFLAVEVLDRAALPQLLAERQLAFWRDTLAGLSEGSGLLADINATSSFTRAQHITTLNPQLPTQLRLLAERRGATLSIALAAALQTFLHRITGRRDICVATLAGENVIAMRSQVDGEDTFSTLLSQLKTTSRDAFAHQDVVLDRRFPVMLIAGPRPQQLPECELAVIVDSASVTFDYDASRFTARTIERLAEHFATLCRAVAAKPIAKIRTHDLLSADEKQRVLVEFNATHADVPQNVCLHDVLPDDPKSHDLAAALQSQGVGPEAIVAVCLERSPERDTAILAVLRAGGAVLPLDPSSADEQLAYFLQDSQAPFVLAHNALRYRLTPLLAPNAKLLGLEARRNQSPRSVVRPNNAALIAYTRTGEGKPKALVFEHEALVRRARYETLFDPLVEGTLDFIAGNRPIANTRVYILDSQNRPQPIGVAGAVHIAGDTIPRGWLHRPKLTDTFVPDPFVAGARMFRTGDVARWLDDATLQREGS